LSPNEPGLPLVVAVAAVVAAAPLPLKTTIPGKVPD